MRFAGNRIFVALALVVIAAAARSAVELGIDVLESNGYALLKNKRVGLITNQTGVDSAASENLTAINIYALAEMNRQLRTNLITQSKRGNVKCFSNATAVPRSRRRLPAVSDPLELLRDGCQA